MQTLNVWKQHTLESKLLQEHASFSNQVLVFLNFRLESLFLHRSIWALGSQSWRKPLRKRWMTDLHSLRPQWLQQPRWPHCNPPHHQEHQEVGDLTSFGGFNPFVTTDPRDVWSEGHEVEAIRLRSFVHFCSYTDETQPLRVGKDPIRWWCNSESTSWQGNGWPNERSKSQFG